MEYNEYYFLYTLSHTEGEQMQVNSNYQQNIGLYENKRKRSETPTFAQCVTEKEEEQIQNVPAADFEERVLQNAGPNAPQSVKDAWMETTKEIGVNGLGETKNGRTHISQMHIQQVIAHYWGRTDSANILGNSVESAIRAAQKALYDFDHPLEPNKVRSIEEQQARVKERQFYVSFLEKLQKLLTENKEQGETGLCGVSDKTSLYSK